MDQDEFVQALPFVRQVSDFNREVQRLAQLAFISPVSNLLNKTALTETLNKPGASEFAAAFLDLSGFKAVNEKFGHAGGDAALEAFGLRLVEISKGRSLAPFHSSGDEFVVLASPDSVDYLLTEATKTLLEKDLEVSFEGTPITGVRANLGFARPDPKKSAQEVVDRAEVAMRVAKARGLSEPVEWKQALTAEDVDPWRRRCNTCQTTTSLLIPKARAQKELKVPCAICNTLLV